MLLLFVLISEHVSEDKRFHNFFVIFQMSERVTISPELLGISIGSLIVKASFKLDAIWC